MRIPLVTGRYFDESDTEDAGQVIILDRWLAQRYFPDEDPIGKRMLVGAVPGMDEIDEENFYTIVGVVGTVKHNDLTRTEHVGAYYFTYKQEPVDFLTLVARTSTQPTAVTSSIRQAVSRIDPDLPFFNPQTMDERVAESLLSRRTPMVLLASFAAVALFLPGRRRHLRRAGLLGHPAHPRVGDPHGHR